MKIWPFLTVSAASVAALGVFAGCGDGKTKTTNVGNPEPGDKPVVDSAPASDPNAPKTESKGTESAANQQPAAQSAASEKPASVALSLTDVKLLANDAAGGLVGVTASGTGFSNVNFPGRIAYTNESVGADQQFSIRKEAHVLLTSAGVKFVSGAITKAAADAAPAVAFPPSFNGTSKVIGLAKDLVILTSGNSIAIFAAGAAPVVSDLPAGFGAALGAGKGTGADAYWFMSANKLAILGRAAGETAYSWVPPSTVTVATPATEALKAIHVKIAFAGSAFTPDPNFFALTDKQLWTLTSRNAGDANSGSGTQTPVGSN